MPELDALYEKMLSCQSCGLRKGCLQVVPGTGCTENPVLMVVGEAPGEQEDEEGEPFVGAAGQLLRDVLRATKVLNRTNTLISNVLKCRPPKNKFPKDDKPEICMSNWLWKEIELAKPQRMLLVGGVPLEYVAGLEGITSNRGTWLNIKGIRTLATFHPSYILRTDRDGMMHHRATFEADIKKVADEVVEILEKRKKCG